MGRTLAGVLLILLLIVAVRYVPHSGGTIARDGTPSDSASCGIVPGVPAADPSIHSSGRRTPRVPLSFTLHPLIFLSTAPADSLTLLKGIGPVLAERIIETRNGKGPFTSWADLLAVKGIGPKKLEMLKTQAGTIE